MGCTTSVSSYAEGTPGPINMLRMGSTDSIDLGKLRMSRHSMGLPNSPMFKEVDSCSARSLRHSLSSGSLASDKTDDDAPRRIPRARSGLMKVGRDVSSQVESLIAGNPVVLFSNTRCPLCRMAKTLLSQVATIFHVVELEDFLVGDSSAYKTYLAEKTGFQTLPWMFISGSSIGDHERIKALQENGELASMCASAGAPEPEEKICRQVSRRSHLKRQSSTRSWPSL